MTVRLTSIAAYRDLKSAGKETTQVGMIISVVAKRANMSLREIQIALKTKFGKFLDVGTISARCKLLKDSGVLAEEPSPRKCIVSKITVHPVRISPEQISA